MNGKLDQLLRQPEKAEADLKQKQGKLKNVDAQITNDSCQRNPERHH